jgi:CO/xanthine dehydrogenase Mo-binding subunit
VTVDRSISDALAEPEYRVEGHLKVTGRARYAADVRQTGMLHAVYVRSPYAHAPFGAKAVGEVTNSGVAPAIANAVADATGARIMDLPITSEKVLAALSR